MLAIVQRDFHLPDTALTITDATCNEAIYQQALPASELNTQWSLQIRALTSLRTRPWAYIYICVPWTRLREQRYQFVISVGLSTLAGLITTEAACVFVFVLVCISVCACACVRACVRACVFTNITNT